jgi:hypothetical protein
MQIQRLSAAKGLKDVEMQGFDCGFGKNFT